MPRRVIDADAMWSSSKLANCREELRVEYAWIYGIADANGNFELTETSLRSLHGKAYAPLRPSFTLQNLKILIEEFHRNGLLYIWEENGKKYGHWIGSEKPGRLPALKHRDRYPCLKVHVLTQDEQRVYLETIGLDSNGFSQTENEAFPTGAELRAQAASKADATLARAAANGDETEQFKLINWKSFWTLYPNKRHESESRAEFWKLPVTDMPSAVASIEAWEASARWKDPQFIPIAKNFLKSGDWKITPPKEKHVGKERSERNLRNLGLHPKMDVPPR
jgi:hypothetical protein